MSSDALMLAVIGLLAALASWLLVAVLVRVAPGIGLVDRPNERSLHARVTPRGGGVGLVLVVVLESLLAGVGRTGWSLEIYLGAGLFIAGVSLRDDFKSLSAGLRFFCQLAAAGAATWGIARFETFLIPGGAVLDFGRMGAALTVVWIVGLTNVYNFMDGIDGLAGVQGLVAGVAWTMAGLWIPSPVVALLGALLAGSSLGFLVHNWSPARIFLGDVGSAFLGFSFAVLPLLGVVPAATAVRPAATAAMPLFALLVVWPFVADGFYTFVRRARRGEAVWRPHRSHLYQRLVQAGWTHAQTSLLYGAWCAVSGAVALLWLTRACGVTAAVVALGSLASVFLLVKRAERQREAAHGTP